MTITTDLKLIGLELRASCSFLLKDKATGRYFRVNLGQQDLADCVDEEEHTPGPEDDVTMLDWYLVDQERGESYVEGGPDDPNIKK